MWGVIPARWASSRLPGKVLADIDGRSILQWVWQRTQSAGCFDRLIVTTDDTRVTQAARAFGADVVPTGYAVSGTHRAAQIVPSTVSVVCVQADQPFVDPDHVRVVADQIPLGGISTACAPLSGDPTDPARVKVVVAEGLAVDFSRRPIPEGGPYRVHLGLYGFGPGQLARAAAAPRTPRTLVEDLEQLAWIDAGLPIQIAEVDHCQPPIDTPGQLLAARGRRR